FFQAEDGIRDFHVTGVQTCALPISVDWEESFNEKSNKPYGVSVFYNELQHLFKNNEIRTVYHMPESYLWANSEFGNGDHIAKGRSEERRVGKECRSRR